MMASRSPSEVRRCDRCDAENYPPARFCQLCGNPLDVGSGPRPLTCLGEPSSATRGDSLPDASLVVIAQDGTPGRHYPLTGRTTQIGRGNGDIDLSRDPYVCPNHARITYRDDRFFIEDLGSVNGIYIRLGSSAVRLRHGDLLLMGLAVIRFEIVEELEKTRGPQMRGSTRVFGTPAHPRHARLLLRTVEDMTRDIFYVSRTETVVGREAGDIVFTDDPFMSRRHAAIRRNTTTNEFTLRDLGSSNGTFIALRGEHPLSRGDHLRLGQHLFRLDVNGGGRR